MSAFGTSTPYAPPPGGTCQTVGAAPPAFATWSRYAVASQALTGFLLRPLRIVLLPKGDEGVRGDAIITFHLDALNRPNTAQGMWIGFACACSLYESGVWGQGPQVLLLVFGLVS